MLHFFHLLHSRRHNRIHTKLIVHYIDWYSNTAVCQSFDHKSLSYIEYKNCAFLLTKHLNIKFIGSLYGDQAPYGWNSFKKTELLWILSGRFNDLVDKQLLARLELFRYLFFTKMIKDCQYA